MLGNGISVELELVDGRFTSRINNAGKALQNFGSQAEQVSQRVERTGRRMRTFSDESDASTQRVNAFREQMTRAASAVALIDGPLGGVASRLTALGMVVQRAGFQMAAFGIALAGLGFAFRGAIGAAVEFEATMKGIDQLLLNTANQTTLTGEKVEFMARRIGRETLASSRDVLRAARELMTYRSISEDVFGQVLELSQDVAEAMGTNIVTATNQLATALEDPERGLSMLSRAQVHFTREQREMIEQMRRTGRVAEMQQFILENVANTVGGTGVAAAQSARGAWDSFGEALRDVNIAFMQQSGILDAWRGLGNALTGIVEGLNNNMGGLVRTVQALVAAMTAMVAVRAAAFMWSFATSITSATAAMTALNIAMRVSPIGWIGAAIGAATGAFFLFRQRAVDVNQVVSDQQQRFRDLGEAFDGARVNLDQLSESQRAFLQTSLLSDAREIEQGLQEVTRATRSALNDVFSGILTMIEPEDQLALSKILFDDFDEAMNDGLEGISKFREQARFLSEDLTEGSMPTRLVNLDQALAQLEAVMMKAEEIRANLAVLQGTATETQRELATVTQGGGSDGARVEVDSLKASVEQLRLSLSSAARNAQEYQNAVEILEAAQAALGDEFEDFDFLMAMVNERYGEGADVIEQAIQRAEEQIAVLQVEGADRVALTQIIHLQNAAQAAGIDITKGEAAARFELAKALIQEAAARQQEDRESRRASRGGGGGTDPTKALQDRIDRLRDERQLVGLVGAARERMVAQMQMERAARQAGVADIQKWVDAYMAEYDALKQLEMQYQNMGQGIANAMTRYAEETSRVADEMEKTFTGIIGTMEDALVDFFMTGKMDFEKFLRDIASQLMRFAVRQMLGGLMGGAGGKMGGGGGKMGGGGLGKIAGVRHSGGMVNLSGATRQISALAFAGAPRFHTGGIIGKDEVPIIAQRGEGVFTAEQMKAMGGMGGPVITVAPNINIEGGSQGPEADEELARKITGELEQMTRAVVVSELRMQMRPGGMVNNVRN